MTRHSHLHFLITLVCLVRELRVKVERIQYFTPPSGLLSSDKRFAPRRSNIRSSVKTYASVTSAHRTLLDQHLWFTTDSLEHGLVKSVCPSVCQGLFTEASPASPSAICLIVWCQWHGKRGRISLKGDRPRKHKHILYDFIVLDEVLFQICKFASSAHEI